MFVDQRLSRLFVSNLSEALAEVSPFSFCYRLILILEAFLGQHTWLQLGIHKVPGLLN